MIGASSVVVLRLKSAVRQRRIERATVGEGEGQLLSDLCTEVTKIDGTGLKRFVRMRGVQRWSSVPVVRSNEGENAGGSEETNPMVPLRDRGSSYRQRINGNCPRRSISKPNRCRGRISKLVEGFCSPCYGELNGIRGGQKFQVTEAELKREGGGD
ncbi:UNVERIFIED_CONTAM: hypothetical protein Sindi_1979200 [Sesamum indicum]